MGKKITLKILIKNKQHKKKKAAHEHIASPTPKGN